MVFIKLTCSVALLLLGVAAVGAIGLAAYSEGYTNGERDGSSSAAQYVAQLCNKGGKLTLYGQVYYCGRIKSL